MMIDMPLKEINPQINGAALAPSEERSFAPWVTSASPYNKPENSFVEIFVNGKIFTKTLENKSIIFKRDNTSVKR